jgi:CubicO group peptidase (beta-lactamase class C family)
MRSGRKGNPSSVLVFLTVSIFSFFFTGGTRASAFEEGSWGKDLADPWHDARTTLDKGVESGVYPGAAAIVGGRNGVLFEYATGSLTYGRLPLPNGQNEPVSAHTVFDLASLSKVIGTTSVVAWLYEKGFLDLDEKISSENLLGAEFSQGGKANVTIRDCMLHQAGFPPDPVPNYWDPTFGCDSAPLPQRQSFACSDRCYQSLMSQPLHTPPGVKYVYSDLSMITMMFAAGKVVSRSGLLEDSAMLPECSAFPNSTPVQLQCMFEAFLRTRIVPSVERASGRTSLGLISYRPSPTFWDHTAPTVTVAAEKINVTLQGRVEDGNSEMLGGISGHAGVFSTAWDLSAFMHTLLFPGLQVNGLPSDHTFLNATTMELFTTEADHSISSRALGWNTNDPTVTDMGWNLSCGKLSSKTFMHLGYTGTQVCGDPVNKVYTVLLTNRVYPTDQGSGIHDVRQEFHNAVAEAIQKDSN